MKLKNSLLYTFVLLLFSTIVSAQQSANQPNIIFILTDDLGWTDLGCYGNQFNETPNLDKLAESGIRLHRRMRLVRFARQRGLPS
jgi:arylsulfatase A